MLNVEITGGSWPCAIRVYISYSIIVFQLVLKHIIVYSVESFFKINKDATREQFVNHVMLDGAINIQSCMMCSMSATKTVQARV